MNNSNLNKLLAKNNYVNRDCSLLTVAENNRVNINAWIDYSNSVQNVGDMLSVITIQEMLKIKNIDVNKRIDGKKHIYGIGSQLLGFQDATIWGGGFASDVTKKRGFFVYKLIHRHYHVTDIRAVRGPLSKKNFDAIGINCPSIYGDPALIMPNFYKPKKLDKKQFLIVPHYSNDSLYRNNENVLNTFTNDWMAFIDKLCSAEFVISSSLHGIILAEAYGIPAIMLRNANSDNIFKFRDYYYSTERFDFPIAENVEEALKMSPSILENNVLQRLQNDIFASFPYDLWE